MSDTECCCVRLHLRGLSSCDAVPECGLFLTTSTTVTFDSKIWLDTLLSTVSHGAMFLYSC